MNDENVAMEAADGSRRQKLCVTGWVYVGTVTETVLIHRHPSTECRAIFILNWGKSSPFRSTMDFGLSLRKLGLHAVANVAVEISVQPRSKSLMKRAGNFSFPYLDPFDLFVLSVNRQT